MENKIKQIIEKEFDAQTLEITRITEGYSHYMYLVKINKAPHDSLLAKIAGGDRQHESFI